MIWVCYGRISGSVSGPLREPIYGKNSITFYIWYGYGRISGSVSGSSREPIFDEDSFGYYLKEI